MSDRTEDESWFTTAIAAVAVFIFILASLAPLHSSLPWRLWLPVALIAIVGQLARRFMWNMDAKSGWPDSAKWMVFALGHIIAVQGVMLARFDVLDLVYGPIPR